MADSTEPTAAAEVAAAANFAELEALSNPKIPTCVVRSKYMLKFHLLDKMDVRRLEIDKKSSNNVSRVYSFCNICFNLTWRMFGVDGKGTYETTKVIRHLKLECTGRGKDCPGILDLVTKETASKNRKTEILSKNLKEYHAAEDHKLEHKGRKTKKSNIRNMIDTQSYHNKALCAQAHLFLYLKSSVPVSMFNDPLFKEIQKAMIPLSCKVDKPPLLNIFGALQYTTSEF